MNDDNAPQVISVNGTADPANPVTINCENGFQVTVNIDVKHYHYGYPEWFDRQALIDILREVRGHVT